ncbi:MAG: DNA-binding protein [Gammaproteobacteria bacterium]|nr:DNA-binding protein [Gammaproteobacteria bacterium]
MQDMQSINATTLEIQLTERFGLLLSQTQLAQLLGRTTGGLRYSLSYPSDTQTRALKDCGRKIGRRVYYPAAEVARIILGPSGG